MSLNKFWAFVVILLFGGAVAAIGTRDLKRELAKRAEAADPEQTEVLLEDLKGNIDLSRASMRSREQVEQKERDSGEKSWIDRAKEWITP